MNQTIKRCLDWSDALIREGTKALAYSIRLGEVEKPVEEGGGDEEDGEDKEDKEDDKDESEKDHDAMSEAQGTEEWIGEVRSELPKWSEGISKDPTDLLEGG